MGVFEQSVTQWYDDDDNNNNDDDESGANWSLTKTNQCHS